MGQIWTNNSVIR